MGLNLFLSYAGHIIIFQSNNLGKKAGAATEILHCFDSLDCWISRCFANINNLRKNQGHKAVPWPSQQKHTMISSLLL